MGTKMSQTSDVLSHTLDQALSQRRQQQSAIEHGDELTRKLVIFTLGEELFAFPGENVREILPMGRIFFVPGCPASLDGVINVRGDIESVISLFNLLGKTPPNSIADEAILLGKTNEMQSGLRVGRVIDVLDVAEKEIQSPGEGLSDQIAHLLSGLTIHAGKVVLILDMTRLFNDYLPKT